MSIDILSELRIGWMRYKFKPKYKLKDKFGLW